MNIDSHTYNFAPHHPPRPRVPTVPKPAPDTLVLTGSSKFVGQSLYESTLAHVKRARAAAEKDLVAAKLATQQAKRLEDVATQTKTHHVWTALRAVQAQKAAQTKSREAELAQTRLPAAGEPADNAAKQAQQDAEKAHKEAELALAAAAKAQTEAAKAEADAAKAQSECDTAKAGVEKAAAATAKARDEMAAAQAQAQTSTSAAQQSKSHAQQAQAEAAQAEAEANQANQAAKEAKAQADAAASTKQTLDLAKDAEEDVRAAQKIWMEIFTGRQKHQEDLRKILRECQYDIFESIQDSYNRRVKSQQKLLDGWMKAFFGWD